MLKKKKKQEIQLPPEQKAPLKNSIEDFEQTLPVQLKLFEMLLPEDTKFSSTIELYDFIPKYFWGKVERINGEFLRAFEREFECRGKQYKVKIHPASIEDKDGVERYYYPSKREELVEDALRKFAVEGQGYFLDDLASVGFTLYQLQQELKKNGHSYSLAQLKDALHICNQTTLKVQTADGATILSENIFVTLGLQTREDWKGTGQKTRAFVRFNSLVAKSIKDNSFRQINYEKSMSYKSVIARQLHKRMSHHYTQASFTIPYAINLSTIIRDFGLTQYSQLRDNLRDVQLAIDEMIGKKVVLKYQTDKVTNSKQRNKLVDVKITFTPDISFIQEMIRANQRHIEIQKQLAS